MPKKPKSQKPPRPVSPAALDKIILLMIGGLTRQDVIAAARKELKLPAGRAKEAMAEARRRITLAADYNRDEVLGQAIKRLDDLYKRALSVEEVSIALSAQREKNRLLLGMIAMAPEPIHEAHGEADEPPQPTPRRSVNIESDELADIVDAIEISIEPLGLTPPDDVNDTDAELINKAAQEIVRLRRAIAKPKAKPKSKPKAKPPTKGPRNDRRQ